MSQKILITYVTSSDFKREENKLFQAVCKLSDGSAVQDVFEFSIRAVPILETLQVDLRMMVQAEVTEAYSQLRVPCIVEHAGLVFEQYLAKGYPGGLTKPMWNALDGDFIKETGAAGKRAVARAVIAYCDGQSVQTFVGETKGTIADAPRGGRQFYWDTVFIPDETGGAPGKLTYAEIVDDPALGLEHKIAQFSQSSKAMLSFLEHRRKVGLPALWS